MTPTHQELIVENQRLRDCFAIAAMPYCLSYIANPSVTDGVAKQVAETSYVMADAMLAARGSTHPLIPNDREEEKCEGCREMTADIAMDMDGVWLCPRCMKAALDDSPPPLIPDDRAKAEGEMGWVCFKCGSVTSNAFMFCGSCTLKRGVVTLQSTHLSKPQAPTIAGEGQAGCGQYDIRGKDGPKCHQCGKLIRDCKCFEAYKIQDKKTEELVHEERCANHYHNKWTQALEIIEALTAERDELRKWANVTREELEWLHNKVGNGSSFGKIDWDKLTTIMDKNPPAPTKDAK